MSAPAQFGAAARIEQFLAKYPEKPLTIAVGFASVKGLAWLARRTASRPVTLLIGDCRKTHFAKFSREDRASAVAFINRTDVVIKNWYRRRPTPAEAHLKVWMVETTPNPAVLVGSANLTGAGLFQNREAIVEATGSDRLSVARNVNDLVAKGWDVKERLVDYISEQPSPAARKQAMTKPKPRGCLAVVLQAVAVVAVAVIALYVWSATLSRAEHVSRGIGTR